MTGNEIAAVTVGVFALIPLTAWVLLVYYIITGNDKPFLKFYSFMLGVKNENH